MTAATFYVDASVLLRVVLGQPSRLKEWGSIRQGVTSALTEVECLRTLDRLRLAHGVGDHAIATRREAVYGILETLEVATISATVLSRAAEAFPTSLGALDSIHLATALLWSESRARPLTVATHDEELAAAARACGLRSIGVTARR